MVHASSSTTEEAPPIGRIHRDATQLVGNTPLLRLNKVTDMCFAEVVCKLEGEPLPKHPASLTTSALPAARRPPPPPATHRGPRPNPQASSRPPASRTASPWP